MSKTRYAIVRVNFVCPNTYEGISYKFVCQNNGPIKNFQCEKCRYGDTKEQLIRKVAQVLFKKFMKTNSRFKGLKKIQVAKRLAYKLAKEIVEFLGVE